MLQEKFQIKGGYNLKGTIEVRGAKNAATPIIAATLLTDEECIIKNVPLVEDVFKMLEILKELGAKVKLDGDCIKITCKNINPQKISEEKVGRLRSSILILGPLLTRFKEFKLPPPGGCLIGSRPITSHLDGLKSLGVKIITHPHLYHFKRGAIVGNEIALSEFSVTATENILMAASTALGDTLIKIAAAEPHVQDLMNFINKMGGECRWVGQHLIKVSGKKKLHGTDHKLIPDPIEAGTFIILAAATRSQIEIKNIIPDHLDLVFKKLKEIGVQLKIENRAVKVLPSKSLRAVKVQALPYPGIPTDLQAPFGVLATQCEGTTLIHDPLYEGRLKYIDELNKMGASAVILDPHRALITGPTPLFGKEIKSLDIRAGATFVIAGLLAKGMTTIYDVYQIDRGYEKIDERLRAIGADIQRLPVP